MEQTNKHPENCPEEEINRTTRRYRNHNKKEVKFTRSEKRAAVELYGD